MTDSNDTPTMRGLGRSLRSRRGVLAGAGALIGAGLLGANAATAQEDGEPADPPAEYDRENTDVDVLAYALTLEHLEDAFYEEGLDAFDDEDLMDASAVADRPEAQGMVVDVLETIAQHEATHTEELTQVIDVLGGDPIERPEFEFGFESADEFLATAHALEDTGVAAYAGAAPRIESPDVLSAALSIHSVEARHAAVLAHLTGESPFPAAFDPAMSMNEVLEAIDPFFPPEETPTPTRTPTETPTQSPTATDSPTPTATQSPTPTATQSPTPTETPTPTQSPTPTPSTPTETVTPTDTVVPDTQTPTDGTSPTPGTEPPNGTPTDGTSPTPGTPDDGA